MKVIIGSDHAGLELKQYLKPYITDSLGHELEDVGVYEAKPADYPDIALKVMKRVRAHEGSRGILLCSTGQGMSMTANCYKRIRTALCPNTHEAEMSRKHNDANILAMGSDIVNHGIARNIVRKFLITDFSNEERYKRRIEKMESLKKKLEVGWVEKIKEKIKNKMIFKDSN